MISSVILLALAACDEMPPKQVSPTLVLANIHQWNGKIVVVDGWLGDCFRENCSIYSSKADMEAVRNGNKSNDDWLVSFDRGLRVGGDPEFDSAIARFQYSRVLLEAKINDSCRRPDHICTDRANDLDPISVESAITERSKT